MPIEVGLIADAMLPESMLHNVLRFRFLRRAFIHSGRLSLVWQRCVTIRLMTRQR